jgi:hypothetical protein
MDKNIAALMREDTKTVHVVFNNYDEKIPKDLPLSPNKAHLQMRAPGDGDRQLTYVTDLDVAPQDLVVAVCNGRFRVGTVYAVDDDCKITPDSEIEYLWLIAKVDMGPYNENMAKNAKLSEVLQEAYRKNLRRSFASQILGGIEDSESRDTLLALIGPSKKNEK